MTDRNEKTERIGLRCTDTEKHDIYAKAADAKQSVSQYLVFCALYNPHSPKADGHSPEPAPEPDPMKLKLATVKRSAVPILHELHRIGVNVNQIARRSNALGRVNRNSLDTVIHWLLSGLMHVVPKQRLLQMTQETEPCALVEYEEEEDECLS